MRHWHEVQKVDNAHTIIVDWDGCAVPQMWPKRPDKFMPGFVKAMNRLHREGMHIRIFSSRLNPHDPYTGESLDAEYLAEEVEAMRALLDAHGLNFIDIHTTIGKPSGSVYIDDKAERYDGSKRGWPKVASRIITRLSKEPARFPPVGR